MRKKRVLSSKAVLMKRIKDKEEIRTNITLRLPLSLVTKLDKACKAEGISRTQLIEELALEFLGE